MMIKYENNLTTWISHINMRESLIFANDDEKVN